MLQTRTCSNASNREDLISPAEPNQTLMFADKHLYAMLSAFRALLGAAAPPSAILHRCQPLRAVTSAGRLCMRQNIPGVTTSPARMRITLPPGARSIPIQIGGGRRARDAVRRSGGTAGLRIPVSLRRIDYSGAEAAESRASQKPESGVR